MKRLYKNILSLLTGSSLVVIFAVILVSSLSRYLLNSPIQWSDEVARYAMIYGAMFGVVLCYLEGVHVRFTFLEDIVSKKIRHILHILSDIVSLGCGVVLIWSGYLFMMKRGGIESPSIGISMYYFQAAIMIGGIGLTIAALIRLSEYFTPETKKEGH